MKMLSPKLVLLFVILFAGVCVTAAQDNPTPDAGRPQVDGRKNEKPNFLRQLGLTPDQMQQIRRMNQARKPEMDRASMRLRMANRALDETIYADTVDDASFQARLRELQAAQADMARLRFTSELGVRKVLTPEQLSRFRELRQRFAPPPPDRRGPVGVDDRNPVPQRELRKVP